MDVEDGTLEDTFPSSPARDAVVAIVRAYGVVQRLMEPYFDTFGLTPPQFQLLTIVNRLGGGDLTQRRLARELYVSFPNVTVMLSRLESAGLIVRRSNPADRREKFVALTPRARSLLQRIWTQHEDQLAFVMQGVAPEDQRLLVRLLDSMIAAHQPGGSSDE
jgi:DNA-binding MarR family transcriptional regulator